MIKRRDLLALGLALSASSALAQTTPAPTTAQPATPPPAVAKPATVRVNMDTGQGRIVIELETGRAPITAGNFLRYVDQKRYDGANFFRASRAPGSADYGLIQGGVQNDPAKVLKPIAHEPTTKTGIKHTDGTLSIGRNAPGTATSDFFICVGDAPYLDADPAASGRQSGLRRLWPRGRGHGRGPQDPGSADAGQGQQPGHEGPDPGSLRADHPHAPRAGRANRSLIQPGQIRARWATALAAGTSRI
jgi:peptidyl-prolyl cis-trans isomerase A (cyclophilin A)